MNTEKKLVDTIIEGIQEKERIWHSYCRFIEKLMVRFVNTS